MREFAALIRKGLQTGAQEDKFSWGMSNEGAGVISANVIGLALIGKVGSRQAGEMFEAAFGELKDDDSPTADAIARELGLTPEQCEFLAYSHFRFSAIEIAEALESGSFQWEPA